MFLVFSQNIDKNVRLLEGKNDFDKRFHTKTLRKFC